MEPLHAVLREIPLFRELDPAEFDKLSAITLHHRYARKTNVFREGEERAAVFFICDGIIKIYKLDMHGNEQIISFLKQGDMFPHTGFFDTTPYPATAEVAESANLLVIPIKAFEQLMLATPSIAIKVMRVMGAKIRELQAKLQDVVAYDVNRRVISFLIRLASEHGLETADGAITIQLPITHQDLASMAGTTRETVNRLLTQLRKEEILEMNRKQISIRDLPRLQAYQHPPGSG